MNIGLCISSHILYENGHFRIELDDHENGQKIDIFENNKRIASHTTSQRTNFAVPKPSPKPEIKELTEGELEDYRKRIASIPDVTITDAHTGIFQVTETNILKTFNVPGYEDLAGVLTEAYDQSARGKGKERHANDQPFTNQPIMRISRGRSGIGGLGYQVQKKTDEAIGMVERGNHEAACKELMGSIVYAAAMILWIREQDAAK